MTQTTQETMKELSRMYNLEECCDKATDSIIIADDYFSCVDVFVFDLLRDQHDLRMRCSEDETYHKFWHIERI